MPYLTNSVILFSFASKNSSQNGQFFKTIPANFGGNKEKYLPIERILFCRETDKQRIQNGQNVKLL